MKLQNKLTVSILALVLLTFLSASAATTVDKALAGVRKAVFSKPSVDIMFTLSSDGTTTQGSASMQDAMITFTTPSFLAWYDGRTQWAYQKSNEEVNISEPTAEEVMALNPFGILAHPETYYTVKIAKETASMITLKMIPKTKGSGIASMTINCTAKTFEPKTIEISFDDGRTMVMTIDRMTPGAKKPASAFRYDSKLWPAREIIDLR